MFSHHYKIYAEVHYISHLSYLRGLIILLASFQLWWYEAKSTNLTISILLGISFFLAKGSPLQGG